MTINNFKIFFSIWFIVILLNQILIFHACFKFYCISSALFHTGVIAFFLTLFINKEEKKVERKISKNPTRSSLSYTAPKDIIGVGLKDELNILLTPDIYLSEKERRKRKDVISCSSLLLLDIVHEKDNPYDSKALLVQKDGIKIGYVVKKGVSETVNNFSFDRNRLKNGIHLIWTGSRFLLTYKKIDGIEVTIPTTQYRNQIILESNIAYKQLYRNIPMYLESKSIDKFYHFTDRNNIQSIIECGGLYSWASIEKNNINSIMSSDELSRQLDTRKGLQDFVRLSFAEKHPMKYIVERKQGLNLVLLEIDVSVACWESTLFSDINATDNDVTIGDDLDFLKRLNYNLFKKKYINLKDQEKKKYQAEILVKDFLPIKYIKNIDILKEKYFDYEEIPF